MEPDDDDLDFCRTVQVQRSADRQDLRAAPEVQPARAMPGQDEAWRKKPLPKPLGGPRVRPPPGDYLSRQAREDGTVDWWSRSRD